MRQLRLSHGDLVLGTGGFEMVEGPAKVAQDLGVLVREALGNDRFHPRWGTVLQDFVGSRQSQETLMLIRSEVQRLIQNFIVVQGEQMVADTASGARSRFVPSEVITAVRDIDVQQSYDRINIKVTVSTASGTPVTVLRTVGSE